MWPRRPSFAASSSPLTRRWSTRRRPSSGAHRPGVVGRFRRAGGEELEADDGGGVFASARPA
eukprot:6158681-Prymnesium_polylepis.1